MIVETWYGQLRDWHKEVAEEHRVGDECEPA
jgi:hypothetical protein